MSETKKVVYVVYYSMYGHIQQLARRIMVGLENAGGYIYLNFYFY